MFCVMLYFASTPTSPSGSADLWGTETLSVVRSPIAYGFTSRLRESGGASMPITLAYSDAEKSARPRPNAGGIFVRYAISFFHLLVRRAWNPQSCAVPGAYLIDLNGMAASMVQPPSNFPATRLHTGFQSALYCRSFVLWPSVRAPSEFASNWMAFLRSRNVSNEKPTESPWRMFPLSRRISL